MRTIHDRFLLVDDKVYHFGASFLKYEGREIPSATTQDNSRLMQALYALNDEAHKNGTAGMSEEKIEAEIKAARAGRCGAGV